MRLLLLAAFLAAGAAFAAPEVLEARQGDDWVHVFDGPCVSAETLGRIDPAVRDQYRKAQGVFQGQKYFGCWRWMGDSAYILWEDGDQGIIPQSEFKPVMTL